MRPPTATRAGTRDSSTARQDRSFFVFFKLAPQGTVRGPGPMRASLFNIVLPPPPPHTHTHTELALAGQQWAAEDNNPLEQFVQQLHAMFLAVLWARKEREEEENLLFPAERRKVELWGVMGKYDGIMGNHGGLWWSYGELRGIMGNYGGIMENFGCHVVCCWLLFILVV